MPNMEAWPEVDHCSGTGALLAQHHTYLGHVVYALTIIHAPHGTPTVAGEFAFVRAPRALSDDVEVSLELADGTWLAITLTYHDPTQNIYTFAGREVYRAHGT